MSRFLSFIIAGVTIWSVFIVGRSFYEYRQTASAPVTAQATPGSVPVAQDKTVTIDINDRFEYWHNIGWETTPKIFDAGDSNNVEDDVSNRAVRDDLIFDGWQRMIDYAQEMVDQADARMIQLHNPFGSASFVDQDLENGAEFPEPGPDGEIDGKPGRRIMQFSQYTDSLHEWTMNEDWAAEHWADFGGQPAMHATLGLWADFLQQNPGVKVRFYVGGPHNDYYVKNLVATYGDLSPQVWDQIWANLVPYFEVGIRDIGVDNSTSTAAKTGPTARMIDVLAHPEKRDPVLDADLIAAIGSEPIQIMIEAKPQKDADELFEYDVLAEEFVWKLFTAPNNLHFPPDDYYIRGRGVRLLTREAVAGETVPVRTAERLIALSRDVLMSGHYVMVPYFWAKLTGVETTDNLLDGVGLFEMPTQINLLSGGNSETDTYTIIKEPDHGTLIVNPNYPYIYHYTSRSDLTGTDSFTYQISNESGQTSLPATVTIQQTGHSYTPVCGNTFVEAGEECDDGNTIDGDGCTSACQNQSPVLIETGPCIFCYLSPKLDVELQHQQSWPTADLSAFGMKTGDTVSINAYVFLAGIGDSFNTVVSRTEDELRSTLQYHINSGVLYNLDIDAASDKAIVIDIEGAIHPKNWDSLSTEDLALAIEAYRRRVKVTRELLPNATLIAWGIPAMHGQIRSADDPYWLRFLDIYEQAREAGVFEYIDGIALIAYLPFGPDDPSYFKMFSGGLQSAIEVAGQVTKQDGTPLKVYPVLGVTNYNGSSVHSGEYHDPQVTAEAIKIFNEYADTIERILFWIAGPGNTEQINYFSTLPYCSPDVCAAEPTDICDAVCSLQSDECSDGVLDFDQDCNEVIALHSSDAVVPLELPATSSGIAVSYDTATWPARGAIDGPIINNVDMQSGTYLYKLVEPTFAGMDFWKVSASRGGEVKTIRVYLVREDDKNFCGNGVIRNEWCDDGNTADGDGCNNYCLTEPGYTCLGEPSTCSICGNGQVDGEEQCDDGNNTDGDGCNYRSQVEQGYDCTGTSCLPVCGDGINVIAEECDDGASVSGDGCSADCRIENGYRCHGFEPSVCQTVSQCDDGLDNDGDGTIDSGDPGCSDALDTSEDGEIRGHNFTFTLQPDGLFDVLKWTNVSGEIIEIAFDEHDRYHPAWASHYLHSSTNSAGSVSYTDLSTGEEVSVSHPQISYQLTDQSEDQLEITATATGLEFNDVIRFSENTMYVNTTVTNNNDDPIRINTPIRLGGFTFTNEERKRMTVGDGGQIVDWTENDTWRGGARYPDNIAAFSPIMSVWDNTFTISSQVLTRLEEPDEVVFKEVSNARYTELFDHAFITELEPGQSKHFVVAFRLSESGDWQTGLEPYKNWMTSVYGQQIDYCPSDPFAWHVGYNSCQNGTYQEDHPNCPYFPDLPRHRYKQGVSMNNVWSNTYSQRMTTLDMRIFGIWASTLRTPFMTLDGTSHEFAADTNFIDPNFVEASDPEKLAKFVQGHRQNGVDLLWYTRPCEAVRDADVTYNDDGGYDITRGPFTYGDLRIKEHRDVALRRFEYLAQAGVRYFYFDATSCPGDQEAFDEFLAYLRTKYDPEIEFQIEGNRDRTTFRMPQHQPALDRSINTDFGYLMAYMTPHATVYPGPRISAADKIKRYLERGFQLNYGMPWNLADWQAANKPLICEALINQNVRAALSACAYRNIPDFCCDEGFLPAGTCDVAGSCGDGVVSPGEQCDEESEFCIDCQLVGMEPICGNGVIESGEQCDDANLNNNDSCTSDCRFSLLPASDYSCPLPQSYWSAQ